MTHLGPRSTLDILTMIMPTRRFATLLSTSMLAAGLVSIAGAAAAADAYYRFPAVRGQSVVFTAEGDLWKAASTGGVAQRLTTHAGAETNAALSHDGRWIAFSASYEGSQEAYVMAIDGGLPKRISFEGGGVTVVGWTRQGEVLVSMQNPLGPDASRIVAAIVPDSLKRRVFAVADANDAVLDDDGTTLYFTRLGLAMTGDNVKRYRGGATAQLYRYKLDGREEAQLVFKPDGTTPVNDRRPMWWNGRLYFISDRDGADRIWSARPDGSDARVHTSNTAWDVRYASLGDGRIAYQLGADLHVLDLASGADQSLTLQLVSDFDQQRRRRIRSPLDMLTSTRLAARTERVVLTARGAVSIAGTGSQRRVELPVPEGARARSAVLSQDERWVYAIVDASGENEIWRYAANGSGKGERLTTDGNNQRMELYPSPDGAFLAHTDRLGRTWLMDLAARTNVVIDDAHQANMGDAAEVVWSPDSKNLAFVRVGTLEDRTQIGVFNLASKQLTFVTGDRYPSSDPAFSPDGRWLYFLSARKYQLSNSGPWGDRNMGPIFDKRTAVYALALQPGNRFPFKHEDELSTPEPDAAAKAASEADKAKQATPVKPVADSKPVKPALPAIVIEGLADRIYEVPVAAGNYDTLAVSDKHLYLLERDSADGKSTLKTLAITRSDPQPEVFAANVRRFALSADGKHVFYNTFAASGPGDIVIVDAGARQPADISKAKVKVDDWTVAANPRQEWRQMYNDAWRMHRDFLYDVKMRGVDWVAVRGKYAPLVERVSDRAELNDVLGMMISEVGALHSQIRPGDLRQATPDGAPAALGAVLSRVADGYRVEHIYRGEPEMPSERGPLAQPDVDVREGDVLTAINGKSLVEARDIADLLLSQADKQVLLHVKRGAAAPKAMMITPVSMARNNSLRYGDWERSRATQVSKASNGRIGYLHLRAMTAPDMATFAREFYANVNKEGLIIDVRRNRGGNIDSWIVEKLLRKPWAFWTRPGRQPYSNMQNTFRGQLVVLVDELTYSDGETFAAAVKSLKLGTLVGKRTAGAGVWLSDRNSLADNGAARVAETGQFALDGQWLIEGVGVVPDVLVENGPHALFAGQDRQLEAALEILGGKLKAQPYRTLQAEPIPPLAR